MGGSGNLVECARCKLATAFARAIGVVLKDQDDLAYIAPRLYAVLKGAA
jgi:hypothetical protein